MDRFSSVERTVRGSTISYEFYKNSQYFRDVYVKMWAVFLRIYTDKMYKYYIFLYKKRQESTEICRVSEKSRQWGLVFIK